MFVATEASLLVRKANNIYLPILGTMNSGDFSGCNLPMASLVEESILRLHLGVEPLLFSNLGSLELAH